MISDGDLLCVGVGRQLLSPSACSWGPALNLLVAQSTRLSWLTFTSESLFRVSLHWVGQSSNLEKVSSAAESEARLKNGRTTASQVSAFRLSTTNPDDCSDLCIYLHVKQCFRIFYIPPSNDNVGTIFNGFFYVVATVSLSLPFSVHVYKKKCVCMRMCVCVATFL